MNLIEEASKESMDRQFPADGWTRSQINHGPYCDTGFSTKKGDIECVVYSGRSTRARNFLDLVESAPKMKEILRDVLHYLENPKDSEERIDLMREIRTVLDKV